MGSIVARHVRVLLRPKENVGIENVFFLLGFEPDLIDWAKDVFPYPEEEDLLRIIAWMLDREIRRQLRRGLTLGYLDRAEELPTVRGRIDMTKQVSRRQSLMLPLECRYQEFTDDVELNRLLKAACRAVQRSAFADTELALRYRELNLYFRDVTDVEYQALPDLQFDRLNQHWRAASEIARIVLTRHSLRDDEGSVVASAFLVDMNKVFEKFIETVVQDEARRQGWEVARQTERRLTPSITIKPDLILRRDNRDFAVGDAKYKVLEIDEWPHADLYQLLAYCVGLRLSRGTLIYARSSGPRLEHVEAAGIDLQIVGIDLSRPHEAVLAQAKNVGQGMVRDADSALRGLRRTWSAEAA